MPNTDQTIQEVYQTIVATLPVSARVQREEVSMIERIVMTLMLFKTHRFDTYR